jgi:hypothetical protein
MRGAAPFSSFAVDRGVVNLRQPWLVAIWRRNVTAGTPHSRQSEADRTTNCPMMQAIASTSVAGNNPDNDSIGTVTQRACGAFGSVKQDERLSGSSCVRATLPNREGIEYAP